MSESLFSQLADEFEKLRTIAGQKYASQVILIVNINETAL